MAMFSRSPTRAVSSPLIRDTFRFFSTIFQCRALNRYAEKAPTVAMAAAKRNFVSKGEEVSVEDRVVESSPIALLRSLLADVIVSTTSERLVCLLKAIIFLFAWLVLL